MTISMSLAIVIIAVIFLLGIIIGSFMRSHVSGKLVIDESGDTERWSFIMDDPIDKIKDRTYISLRIEKVK